MEEVVLKVKVEGSGDSEAKVKSIKQQLREAKEAALQAKEGTEEYFQALNKAAGLADQIGDVNKAVNALDPGAKAQAFGTLINSVAGGFQTITGLYGLLGQKSEDVEKLLLRVQAASALAMGVQSLVEAGKQWNVLKTVILDVYDDIKKAGTATQLGLIGIAATIATIVYQLATAKTETDKLIESTDEFNKTAATEISTLNQLVAVAKDENQSKANREKAIKKINELSPQYLGDIKLETIDTDKATAAVNAYTQALLRKAKAQAAQEELVKRYKNLIDLQIQFNALDAKQLSQTGIKSEVVRLQYEVIGDAYRKTVGDIDTLTKMVIDNSDTVNTLLTDNASKTQQAAKDTTQVVGEQFDYLKAILDNAVNAYQEYLDMQSIVAQSVLDNENLLNQNKQSAQADNLENTKKVLAQEQALYEQSLKDKQDIENAKLSIAQNSLNGLNALGDLLSDNGKKNTAFQKTLAIAQIAIDTAKSIAATISGATQAAAAGGPAAPFLQVAYITSGIASVLSAMASAKKALQQPEISQVGGGGGNLNLPTASGITPPSIQPANTSGFIQQDEQNFKVYVVESDITNTQQGVQQNKKKALLTI